MLQIKILEATAMSVTDGASSLSSSSFLFQLSLLTQVILTRSG